VFRDAKMEEVNLAPAPDDGILPEGFFVTSNRKTKICLKGKLIPVKNIRMDCCIVVDPLKEEAICLEPRKVKKGDLIVVGNKGVIEEGELEFMTSPISPERPAWIMARDVAKLIKSIKGKGGRIFVVAGPAVVHAGGREALAKLIRMGFVDVLITGNGLAVHDMEASIYGTSLGRSLKNGRYVHHAHHIWTINKVNSLGSIANAVKTGLVRDGIMYECVVNNVKYIIVGSIRDDGPLKDTITDMIKAQDIIRAEITKGVDLVLGLASALLVIGVANMLPYDVTLVVVDINPSVLIKIYDRGSKQTICINSDVGLFLRELVRFIEQEGSSTVS